MPATEGISSRLRVRIMLLVLVGLAVALLRVSEPWSPRLAGHTAEYWADHLLIWDERKPEISREAEAHLLAMEGDAVPALGRILRSRESGFKLFLRRWDHRMPRWFRNVWPTPWYQSADPLHAAAIETAGKLGPVAAELTPLLISLLKYPVQEDLRIPAARALGQIAPGTAYEAEALKALIEVTANVSPHPDRPYRREDLQKLADIHAEAGTSFVTHASKPTLIYAVESLERFGSRADAIVPVLCRMAQEPIFEAKYIHDVIELIDPDAASAVVTPENPEHWAALAIRDYGGFLTMDESGHVTGVNLVYHDDESGVRRECDNRSDKAAIYLEDFPVLRELYIQQSQATDWAMQYIGQLDSVEMLMMWDAQVTDRGIALLGNLQNLRYLHVSNAGITDASLFVLSTLNRVEGLSLQGNRFTNAGLRHLRRLPSLVSLWVGLGDSSGISDAGMAFLSDIHTLKEVEIQNSAVTDQGLARLTSLSRLERVVVGGTGVTPTGIARLKVEMPGLVVSD